MSENDCAEARRGARASTASVVERIVEEDDEGEVGKAEGERGSALGSPAAAHPCGRTALECCSPHRGDARRLEARHARTRARGTRGGGRVRSSGLGREQVDRRRLAGGHVRASRTSGEAQICECMSCGHRACKRRARGREKARAEQGLTISHSPAAHALEPEQPARSSRSSLPHPHPHQYPELNPPLPADVSPPASFVRSLAELASLCAAARARSSLAAARRCEWSEGNEVMRSRRRRMICGRGKEKGESVRGVQAVRELAHRRAARSTQRKGERGKGRDAPRPRTRSQG